MLLIEVSLNEIGVEVLPEGPYGAKKYFQSAEKKHIFHTPPGTAEV